MAEPIYFTVEERDALARLRGEPSTNGGVLLFGEATTGLKVDIGRGRYFDFETEEGGSLDQLRERYLSNGHAQPAPETDEEALHLHREQALLGMLLVSPSLIEAVDEEVSGLDFIHQAHAQAYSAMRDACVSGERPTIDTIAGVLQALGGAPYGARLMAEAPMFASYEEGAAFARQAAREIRQLAEIERGDPLAEPVEIGDLEPPRQSKFGLMLWSDQAKEGGEPEYEFIIQALVPAAEPLLIYGESQSGKSFITFHMAMCLARGLPFFGRKVLKPMGVVYCAYEAGRGFRDRLRGYRNFHGIDPAADIPFALLTRPIDLWQDEKNWQYLVDEIRWIVATRFNGAPLGAVVIDTHNAATPGASEIDGKEVSTIVRRYLQIRTELACSVWIVSHKNAEGRLRGNLQLYNRIETALDISKKLQKKDGQMVPVRDPGGHILRSFVVRKQREGTADAGWDFVLRGVETGRVDAYGEKVTSCVPTVPGEGVGDVAVVDTQGKAFIIPPGFVDLKPNAREIFVALVQAIRAKGQQAPADVRAPRDALAVHYQDWFNERMRQLEGTEVEPKLLSKTVAKHLAAARVKWRGRLIDFDKGWYWRTSRKVAGVDRTPREAPGQQASSLMTDEDISDFVGGGGQT